MRRLFPLVAALAVGAACAADAAEPRLAPSVTSTTPSTTAPPTIAPAPTAPPATATPPPSSTVPPPTSAPAPVDETIDCTAGRPDLEAADASAPDLLVDRLSYVLASDQWAGVDRSISVWIEGYGEVLADDPDLALLPASNQKILSAVGTALLLDDDHRFRTVVLRQGDDLVLVGGGDPTLARTGPNSLEALARQVAAAGVGSVDRVLVDTTRFEEAIAAPGWLDYHIPSYIGPMSALMVDDNRYRTDDDFVDDAPRANGQLFAFMLAQQGIEVTGAVEQAGPPADAEIVASVESAPVSDLVVAMMRDSDNEVAEALVREIGDGGTVEGLGRIHAAVDRWCLGLTGQSGDGSGLGRASFRSAREWRRLLQVIDEQPWGDDFRRSLAVAGESGTLEERFVDTPAQGAVQAKTGSIFGGRSLSGYTSTADGREVVFSIVTNGSTEAARASRDAIDGLIVALVTPL